MPKKPKTKKKRFQKIREKFKIILTRKGNDLYYKTKVNEKAKKIKPKNKTEKTQLNKAVKQMEKDGIQEIQVSSSFEVKRADGGKKNARKKKGDQPNTKK